MKVKNTCGKIINFGSLTLLPGEIGTLPAGFEKNPVVKAFVEKDNITILADTTVSKEDAETVAVPENLEALKKDELIALCKELGVEVLDTDTKAVLVEKIKEAKAD